MKKTKKILMLLPILVLTSCKEKDYVLIHIKTDNEVIHYCTNHYFINDQDIHIEYEKDKYFVTSIENIYYWTNTQDCPICGYHANEIQKVYDGIFG